MALLAMCFKLMQEEVLHKLRMFGKKFGLIHECDEDKFLDDLIWNKSLLVIWSRLVFEKKKLPSWAEKIV